MSLDHVFRGDVPPRRVTDLFRGRSHESDVFRLAVARHLARLTEEHESPVTHAHDNVLTFYGIGGRGKSTLSQRLERWIQGELGDGTDWGVAPTTTRPVLTTRIDLAELETFDVERTVLQLRATAGALDAKCYAFDIAFALWWRQYHGSREMTRLPIARGSQGAAAEIRGHVVDQLQDTSVAVLEEFGAAFGLADFGMRVAKRLARSVRHRYADRVAAKNRYFEPVLAQLGRKVDLDVLSQLPILLGEDLRLLEPGERPLWIVFVDTYEHLNDSRRRAGEREFQRMVIGLPDVLWVVTGRRRIDWIDRQREGTLDRVGAAYWPGLAATDLPARRQHLIDDISDDDARGYIAAATLDLGVAVSTDVVEIIVRHANGMPLFLDRYVSLLRETIAQGGGVDPDDFDVAFDGLVERIVSDLDDEERRALLAACVFPRFSPSLVAATVEHVSEAAVIRLLSKGLAEPHDWPLFAYKIHDALRTQIRRLSPGSGGWTAGDWAARAARGLDAISAEHDRSRDADRQRDCFTVGMSVALDFGLEADWLIAAAGGLPVMEQAAQAVPPVPKEREKSWPGYLAAVLQCWIDDGSGRPRHRRLAELTTDSAMPRQVYGFAQRFRAYSRRNHDDPAGGLEIFDGLIKDGIPSLGVNVRQRCFMLHALGRFADAAADYPRLIEMSSSDAEMAVVHASASFYHARLRESADKYRLRYEDTFEKGRLRLARDNLADCLAAEALLSPPDLERAEHVRREIAQDGLGTTFRTACFAVALMASGGPQYEQAADELETAFELPHEPGESGHTHVWRRSFAPAFDAAVRGDATGLAACVAEIRHVVYQWIANSWLTRIDPAQSLDLAPMQWSQDPAGVEERWWQIVLDRRAALPSTHLTVLEP